MNEFKGTPGPWLKAFAKNVQVEGNVHIIKTTDNYHVGYASGWTDDEKSKKEAEANAYVISAAPELLKALQESLPIWENLRLDVSEASILIDCRLAIEKALGK